MLQPGHLRSGHMQCTRRNGRCSDSHLMWWCHHRSSAFQCHCQYAKVDPSARCRCKGETRFFVYCWWAGVL